MGGGGGSADRYNELTVEIIKLTVMSDRYSINTVKNVVYQPSSGLSWS